MSRKPCPFANESCKYWDRPTPGELRGQQSSGCYSDRDHVIPRRLAKQFGRRSLERQIIYDPDNIVQLCREQHDEKTVQENDAELLLELGEKVVELTGVFVPVPRPEMPCRTILSADEVA